MFSYETRNKKWTKQHPHKPIESIKHSSGAVCVEDTTLSFSLFALPCTFTFVLKKHPKYIKKELSIDYSRALGPFKERHQSFNIFDCQQYFKNIFPW